MLSRSSPVRNTTSYRSRTHRKIRPLGLGRFESSAEHSWQLALFALALGEAGGETGGASLDVSRVVGMLLVHDLGEIDAGAVFAFADTDWAARRRAERAAVERICQLAPAPAAQKMIALWEEFDQADSPEARLAYAIDRAMPVLQNLANGGQSWRENGISHDRVVAKVEEPIRRGCPPLWAYLEARLRAAVAAGVFRATEPAAAVAAADTSGTPGMPGLAGHRTSPD